MKRNYLRKLLLSPESRLLMTSDAYTEAMMICFPPSLSGSQIQPQSFWDEIPSYKDETKKAIKAILQMNSLKVRSLITVLKVQYFLNRIIGSQLNNLNRIFLLPNLIRTFPFISSISIQEEEKPGILTA